MIKLIIWALLCYLVYRIAGNVMKIVKGYNNKIEHETKQKEKSKYHIKSDDVIDAHFEEITTTNQSKPKEKV